MTTTEASILLSEPLDKLPVHLNAVLIQIGKLFRHQAHPEQKVVARPKTQAQEAIIKSTRQFHEALDEVETTLLDAASVLERDLNKIKARQAEREIAQRNPMLDPEVEEPVEIQDTTMQDYPEDVPIKDQTPTEQPVTDLPDEQLTTETLELPVNTDTEPQTKRDSPQDLKDLGLGDDLFGEGIADDFGPVDENASFDIFNTTTGGEFDMDFSMPVDNTSNNNTVPVTTNTTSSAAVTSTATVTAAAPASDPLADGDLLMQEFGDIDATGDTGTNDFGDIDFGTIDQGNTDMSNDDNPFGNHNNDSFDDFFNS